MGVLPPCFCRIIFSRCHTWVDRINMVDTPSKLCVYMFGTDAGPDEKGWCQTVLMFLVIRPSPWCALCFALCNVATWLCHLHFVYWMIGSGMSLMRASVLLHRHISPTYPPLGMYGGAWCTCQIEGSCGEGIWADGMPDISWHNTREGTHRALFFFLGGVGLFHHLNIYV